MHPNRGVRLQAVATAFGVTIRPERERVIVTPRGELDLATVDELRAELDGLARRGFTAIVLDLRELEFMDSAGLRLVLDQTARADATVTLIEGGEPVSRLFDLTGVRKALPFEELA